MTPPVIEGPIWLVGCGNMGGAMLRRWLATGLDPARVTVIRPSGRAVADGVTVVTKPSLAGPAPALVMLAVKPQKLAEIAPDLAPYLAPDTLLISILAGVEIASLRRRFAAPSAIVRAMPNTPVGIGRGVVALSADGSTTVARDRVAGLMAPLGLVEWVEEAMMDVVTALAGSGPAFLFRFADALAQAGAATGLAADQAQRLAVATVAGASELAVTASVTPHALAEQVASPGGSTRKGLDVLDAADGLVPLLERTLTAAIARNREMAAAARE